MLSRKLLRTNSSWRCWIRGRVQTSILKFDTFKVELPGQARKSQGSVEQTAQPAHVVRFGVYEIDLEAGELRKHGRRIRLQEQPFQVLALLLDNPGRLVTREELQKRIWPADTFVDFDLGLN